MKMFKPIYEEKERPLIGFKLTSDGSHNTFTACIDFENDLEISITDQRPGSKDIGKCFYLYFNKDDAQSFVKSLQKVINNMK